jgi:8-oxo-dGTP pyrophosphatase MutT (NUDIX family)
MRQATLCLVVDKQSNKILLGMKKKGFGAGKINGFGGKVEKGEEVKTAALRELQEEAGITVPQDNAHKAAELNFFFPHQPDWNQTVHVFIAHTWNGDPAESDEMAPQWFNINEIPYNRMWVDDIHWLPKVLSGEKIEGHFTFGREDGTLLDVKIQKF